MKLRFPALAGVLWLATAAAAPLDPDAFPAPGTYIWMGQYRLHLHCLGRGSPTVVLDAGLGGNSLDWVRVQPEVAKFTRVCSYDRAGYGWSDAGRFPRTAATIVEELRRLLGNGSVAAPYVLVGHSFGGLSMRLFANRFPQRIAGLVLVDATHEEQFSRLAGAGLRRSLVPARGRQFVIANHQQIPDALPAAVREIARTLVLSPDSIRSLYSELRHLQLSAEHVLTTGNRLPDVPLVVIAHDSRARARSERARRMAEAWLEMQRELALRTSRGRLVIAERSGHHVQLERPDLVIEAIRSVVEASR